MAFEYFEEISTQKNYQVNYYHQKLSESELKILGQRKILRQKIRRYIT